MQEGMSGGTTAVFSIQAFRKDGAGGQGGRSVSFAEINLENQHLAAPSPGKNETKPNQTRSVTLSRRTGTTINIEL